MKFGDVVKNLLETQDMTQKQMANDIRMPASTLGNYIRNMREPDIETIKQIAHYFGVSTDFLLDFQHDNVKTHSEDELIQIYRSMSESQRNLLLRICKVIYLHSPTGK